MKRLAILFSFLATALAAHPHIFVATGISVTIDDAGQLAEIEVTWEYDELYSLMITEDMSLDPDYDGKLTSAEIAKLDGFDMNWHEEYYGDTVARLDGTALELSRPIAHTASFSDGKITTTHRRSVKPAALLADQALVIKPFDETFYTAYDITLPVKIIGRDDCQIGTHIPQMTEELSEARAALASLPPNLNPEDVGLPNVGEALAPEVRITCPAL